MFTELKNKNEELVKNFKIIKAKLAVLEELEAARKKAEQETELLKNIIISISEADVFYTALEIALKKVCESTKWNFGQAWIPKGDYLVCGPAWYENLENLEKFRHSNAELKFKYNNGLPGKVWFLKSPLWVQDVSKHEDSQRKEIAKEAHLKSGILIPIISKEKVLAIIEFFISDEKEEDIHLISLISTIATQLGIVFERIKVEEELKMLNESILHEKEKNFQMFFLCNPNPMLIYDLESLKILEANQSLIISYGYSKQELLSMTIFDIRPKEDIPKLIANLKKERGEFELSGEWRHLKKNGEIIDVEIVSHTIRLAEKNSVLVTAKDISAKKKYVETLIETQRRFSTLINNLPGVTFRCANDSEWTMEYLNEGCFELTGYKSEELINNNAISYNSLIIPEDRKHVWDTIQDAIQTKKNYIIEYRIKTKDGKIKWVWEKGCGVFSHREKVEAIEGFIIDVSDQKALMAKLEIAKIQKQKENEIKSLEKIYYVNSKDIISQLFSLFPLQKSHPVIFNEILTRYQSIIKPNSGKSEISKQLKKIAEELCNLKAGPSDVVELHRKAIDTMQELDALSIEGYIEKSRFMMLELIGYMLSCYRKYSLISNDSKSKK